MLSILLLLVSLAHGDLLSEGRHEKSLDCASQLVQSTRKQILDAKSQTQGVNPTVGIGEAILIFGIVGAISLVIATAFRQIRKTIYKDSANLDTAFDAGGNITIGLTATTVVSQWTWAATLLQSTSVASSFGISGSYWYAAGASIQIILFAILSIMFNIHAPGAKTFLQVIRARFGLRTHSIFCCFAFFTNLVVTLMLMLGGTAVLTSLVKGLSPELASMLLAIVIGSYTLVGGVGAVFYVSYFNCALMFIIILVLIVEIFYNPYQNPNNPFGSSTSLYQFVTCWKAPDSNAQNSYMTFFSSRGLIFGIINIVGNFGAVFCDQAYWQSSVAAKPIQGVWGFIAGGLAWFSIPFALATTMGLAYLGLSSAQGYPLLTDDDVAKGLSAPLVAQKLLGTTGEYAIIVLVLMAVMSTASAEIMAVTSIIIYDIYQVYIEPFRSDLEEGECILCRNLLAQCVCINGKKCKECKRDDKKIVEFQGIMKPHYTCTLHKEFREYQDKLLAKKNWAIIGCTFFIIPLVLVGWSINLNLGWTYYFMGVLISSGVIPIIFAMTWPRASSQGMISGILTGCISGISSWLAYTAIFEGGLGDFIANTGKDFPMLVGNVVSIVVGGVVCFVVSIFTRKKLTAEEVILEWEKTRNIDNPINPWNEIFKRDLGLKKLTTYHDRPTLEQMRDRYKTTIIIAISSGIFFSAMLIVIWPSLMLVYEVVSSSGFEIWSSVCRGWVFVAAIFIIVVPLYEDTQNVKLFNQGTKPTNYKVEDKIVVSAIAVEESQE